MSDVGLFAKRVQELDVHFESVRKLLHTLQREFGRPAAQMVENKLQTYWEDVRSDLRSAQKEDIQKLAQAIKAECYVDG